jgi:hypothetical protein
MAKKRPTSKKAKSRKKRARQIRLKSAPKGKTTKTLADLRSLRNSFAAQISAGVSPGCCWFKDPSGRDYPVPSPSAEACKNEGGQWDPAPCPNE